MDDTEKLYSINEIIFAKVGFLSRITILWMSVSVCLTCFIIGTVVIIVFDICMSETAVAMVNFQGLNEGLRFKNKWLCAAVSQAVNQTHQQRIASASLCC